MKKLHFVLIAILLLSYSCSKNTKTKLVVYIVSDQITPNLMIKYDSLFTGGFRWLKDNGISDKEMLKTFNCGVGFCIIIDPKNLDKVISFFSDNYKPYIIGKILNGKKRVKLNEKIIWSD